MAMADLTRIGTNIGALYTLNALQDVNRAMATHQARLATGKRITEAADDPAGLTLATKFENRALFLQQAMDNIGDAKNLLSVGEGGLKKINTILSKMRVKSEQAASDTLGAEERTAIAQDLGQYAKEIDDIVDQTTWNGQKLLDGLTGFSNSKIVMQTGAQAGETTELDAAGDFGNVGVKNNSSGAAGSLASLATIAATSTAAKGTLTAGTTGALTAEFTLTQSAATAGFAEVATGSYTARMVITTDNNANGGTFQLFDSGGAVVNIDNGSGVSVQSRTFSTLDAGGAVSIDTGVGITLAFTSDDFTGTGTATLGASYTKAGDYTVDVSDATKASSYMTNVDNAIKTVSTRLQKIGSLVSRFGFKEEALAISKLNTESAFNRIMNADMAQEQLESVKLQILQQTGTAMLAQANQAPQSVLRLFQ